MAKPILRKALYFTITIFLLIALLLYLHHYNAKYQLIAANTSADTLLLLVPNEKIDPNLIAGWHNAATEEGLHLQVITANEFLQPFAQYQNYPGIILPDTIHKNISPVLADSLSAYVKKGGALMLVFDAGTLNLQGAYYRNKSLFSELAGVDYAQYDQLKSAIIKTSKIGQNQATLDALGVPPGKYVSLATKLPNLNSRQNQDFQAIASYDYGTLNYPYFSSSGQYDGQKLLLTPDQQLIAGVRTYGKGKVLFVNVPLTYLWQRTDAMLMHLFLHYFAVDILHLPILSAVPNGIGGIIMNLHLDSNATLVPLSILAKHGLFKQGPYSISITAGPDTDQIGDGLGLNVPHNLVMQQWIRYFLTLNYAVGSHGGWIHNYFGLNINENNAEEFAKYLPMNTQALEAITQQKVIEYAAPEGNQPSWATRYLEDNNFTAYYTTSNTGTMPSRNFSNGKFDKDTLWSFPLLPLGEYAAFEEFTKNELSATLVTEWLLASTQFMANQHTVRLIYYHPPGLVGQGAEQGHSPYLLESLPAWLAETKRLSDAGKFRWYTMSQIANFMDSRKQVTWAVKQQGQIQTITATHPISLESHTWLLQKNHCQKPNIINGLGVIRDDERNWIVSASATKSLQFSCAII